MAQQLKRHALQTMHMVLNKREMRENKIKQRSRFFVQCDDHRQRILDALGATRLPEKPPSKQLQHFILATSFHHDKLTPLLLLLLSTEFGPSCVFGSGVGLNTPFSMLV